MSFIRDGDRFDVHCDALMSIRMVTDENGDVVLRRDFDAWGGELAGGLDNVPGGFAYGFVGAAGCRRDSATGLVYMRQRWYHPQLRQFVSRDPIGLAGGTNLYTYCANAPTDYIDPTGERVPGANPAADVVDIAVGTVEVMVGTATTQADTPAPGPGDAVGIPIVVDGWGRIRRGAIGLGIGTWATLRKGHGDSPGREPKKIEFPRIDDDKKPDPVDPPAPPKDDEPFRRRRVCKKEWEANVNVSDNCRTGKRGLKRLCHYKCVDGGFINLIQDFNQACQKWIIE